MTKRIFFCCIIFFNLISCDDTKEEKAGTTDKKDSIGISPSTDAGINETTASDGFLIDDSVFDDGSKPTDWKVAGITDVVALKQFINTIKVLAAGDYSEELSTRVRYPLNNSIKTGDDFIASYDKIITSKIKHALATSNPRQLFRNSQGVMIGKGEIWIRQEGQDFKIIAINN